MSLDNIRLHFEEANKVLERFLSSEENFINIKNAGEIICNSVKANGKIISCGNGGSMSDAIHFSEELTGRFRDARSRPR